MTVTPLAAAWTNIALNATLTAFSEASAMLVSKLQQEDIRRNYRTGTTTLTWIFSVFTTNQSADTFALFNTNLTAAGIVRLRLYPTEADAGAGTNVIFDSNPTATAGTVDPNYKDAIVLAPTVQSGWKTARWDLSDTSLTYIEAGFQFIGTRTQFAYYHSKGAGRTRVDPSIHKKVKGGQTKIRRRPAYWEWNIPIDWITEVQTNGVVEQIDLLNGRSLPVLFIMNPSSSNLGKDSIFGLIQESSPVVPTEVFDSAGGVISSKSYKIEQRL